ncbi:hypothetical protein JCM8097_003211 [Rhodosporidiobolus ruineniae]
MPSLGSDDSTTIGVRYDGNSRRLTITPRTTVDELLAAAQDAFVLSFDHHPSHFTAALPPDCMGKYVEPLQPLQIRSTPALQNSVSLRDDPWVRLEIEYYEVVYLKHGFHPVYAVCPFDTFPTWADVLATAQDRSGVRGGSACSELNLLDGGGGTWTRISSAREWKTVVEPLVKRGRRNIREAPTLHLGPLGPTPLTAPALSHLSSSLGTLSLFPPSTKTFSTFSTLDSSTDDGDGVSTVGSAVGSEGTVQF